MLKRYIEKTATGINAAAASVALAAANPVTVKNATSVSALFTRATHTAGSGLFEVYGSIDGVNYKALPLLSMAANTNAQTLTRVVSVSLASNVTVIYPIESIWIKGLMYIKGQYTKTTDGVGTMEFLINDELMS